MFFVAFRRYCGLWTTHSRPQVVFNFPTGLLLVFPFFSVSPTTSSHIGLSLALIAHASSLVLCNTFSEIPWLNKRQSPLLRQKRGRGKKKLVPKEENTWYLEHTDSGDRRKKCPLNKTYQYITCFVGDDRAKRLQSALLTLRRRLPLYLFYKTKQWSGGQNETDRPPQSQYYCP